MSLQVASDADILTAGLAELGEGKWTDISFDLQNYLVLPKLTKQGRVEIQSGHSIQWDVITDENYTARMTGLFSSDNINATNVLTSGSLPWRFSTAGYVFDLHEVSMNSGGRQIVPILKARRHSAMLSVANMMEHKFCRAPASPTDDDPMGLPYWVVKNNTTGFNGGTPSGHTTVGGISTTTYPRWKNYTAQYVAVSKDDLIAKLKSAMTLTYFEPPVNVLPNFNTGDTYMLLTTLAVQQGMEQLLEAQNENLGSDLDSQNGSVRLRRVPVTWWPKLDQDSAPDTTNPVYGVNFGEFKTAVHANWWMREYVQDRMPGMHNVSGVFIDSQFNFLCRNRRRNFVVATDTTMPA